MHSTLAGRGRAGLGGRPGAREGRAAREPRGGEARGGRADHVHERQHGLSEGRRALDGVHDLAGVACELNDSPGAHEEQTCTNRKSFGRGFLKK